jgi:hypothetical protein
MFGHLKARPILTVGDSISTEEAIQRLTTESEGAQPVRWFEFPLAVLLCVTATKDPDSGALFVLDRNRNVWLWIYCEDDPCRGYSGSDLDRLVQQYDLLSLVERPALLSASPGWILEPGKPAEMAYQA